MENETVNNTGATPDVVKGFNMIYAYIGLGVLVIAGAGYVYFTQKPQSAEAASAEKEAEKNKEQNKVASPASSTPSAPPPPDFINAKDATAIYAGSPKLVSNVSLGSNVNISAGVSPRRLNENLGYAGDGESKHVAVTLGTAWGFSDSGHNLIKDSSGIPKNVIVKANDRKVAAFYEVPFGDLDTGGIGHYWSNITSFFDDGAGVEDCDEVQSKRYIGADGFSTPIYYNALGIDALAIIEKAQGQPSIKNSVGSTSVTVIEKAQGQHKNNGIIDAVVSSQVKAQQGLGKFHGNTIHRKKEHK